jgi:photosystem II stability/assembly factor-like uncharacterized protein
VKISQLPSILFLLVILFVAGFALKSDKQHLLVNSKWAHPGLSPSDLMAMQRAYPYGIIKQESYLQAMEQTKKMMMHKGKSSTVWTFAGPDNIGGRITDIEISPENDQVIYLGAATGGVLLSINGGQTWQNLFTGMPVISVGDIAVDPSNPNTVWCGTGEANSSSFSFLGNGIYRSDDGGFSWQNKGLSRSTYIGRVIVDYSNSNRVFAAACGNLFSANDERGIYRTTDGGNNWQRVLFLTDSTSAVDLVQHPTNPNILYACMWERVRGLTYRRSFGYSSGIYKTIDAGNTWTKLTNGLPNGQVGRIGIDISRNYPDILYAVFDLPGEQVGVYKTTNGGATWNETNDGYLQGMMSNFGWYFGQIRIDPTNPQNVFVMGVPLYYSNDGGATWQESGNMHVDHHAMCFSSTGQIFEGNDGGLYKSSNGGQSWTKINNLGLTQFYAIDIDYLNPEVLIGGTQDNNTIITHTGATDDWFPILGGDGMYCLIDYTNPDILYAEYQYGNLYRSEDRGMSMGYISYPMSGDRVYWSAPLVMHPEFPQTLYFGTYRVWKTNNKGDTWTPLSGDLTGGLNNAFSTLSTMDVSALDPSLIVTGSCDGRVNISKNGGFTWSDISAGLPERWITKVKTDPNDVSTIYVTLSGFRWEEAYSHVYKSTDLGETWQNIGDGLPEIPVNDLVIDPLTPGRLIVGTDAGVYATPNDGAEWYWIWNDLPAVPVCALKIHQPDRTVVAGTYGLSMFRASLDEIFTDNNPLQQSATLSAMINPNPVVDDCQLSFYLLEKEQITVELAGTDGKIQKEIFSGNLNSGKQKIDFSLKGKAHGVYYVLIKGGRVKASVTVLKI